MSLSSAPPTTATPTPRAVRVLATANLAAQIGIIVTGGVVRLTGSGLGCSEWPLCEPGEFTPVLHEATSYHPFVEFGNRTLTGVLSVIAIALVVMAWRDKALWARPLRWLLIAPIVGIAIQAVVGGITVLVDLHPGIVGMHFLISAALVWVSALLVVRLREGDARPTATFTQVRGPSATWLRAVPAVFALLTLAVVVLGVLTTGSGPHSGDEEVGVRFAIDNLLVARWHAMSVWAFVAALLATLWVVARTGAGPGADELAPVRHARRAWGVLLLVTLAQGLIGYVQFFNGLPIPLVTLHLLGSALLVAATTVAVTALRVRA